MRIFQVFEFSTNTQLGSNRVWYRNLYEPLVDLGHDVVLMSAAPGRAAMAANSEPKRKVFSQQILARFQDEHKKNPFQLAFFYVMDGMLDLEVISIIRSFGVITTNFSCNNIHQFGLVSDISSAFDLNLHSEKDAKALFTRIGVPALWWPMASNPNYFMPYQVERTIDASFVGQRYARRFDLVYQLLLNGIDVHVFGPNWKPCTKNRTDGFYDWLRWARNLFDTLPVSPSEGATGRAQEYAQYRLWKLATSRYGSNFHEPVTDEQLVLLYSRSHVTLGALEVFEGHSYAKRIVKHMHLRDFEACMAGALYLTDASPEVEEMFEPGRELLVASGFDEKRDMIRFYCTHPRESDAIRENARKRSLSHHTYHKRFTDLFAHLGLESR